MKKDLLLFAAFIFGVATTAGAAKKKQSRRTHRHSEGKTAAGGPGYFDTCKQESAFGFHQCQ